MLHFVDARDMWVQLRSVLNSQTSVVAYHCISSSSRMNGCSHRTVACFVAAALAPSEAETAADLFQRSR